MQKAVRYGYIYNDMPTKNDVVFNTAILSTNNLTWKLSKMSAPVNAKPL